MLLMQAAWILTTPAFRGPDEFDHVYQAAAVTRGQWSAHEPAPNGRGAIVTIPESIVRAASPVCAFYKYVGHDNCYPIRTVGHGLAEVATAAGTYNPAYYLVTGGVTRLVGGAAADLAMRAVSALLCALLVSWAAAVISRWASTSFPLVTLSVGLTPALVYSTAIAAPNGMTYASAALVWASLLGLVLTGRNPPDERVFALPLTVGSVVLVTTHTTGAMWLLLSLVVAFILRPVRHWVSLVMRRWRLWTLVATTVALTIALCTAWIRIQHTNTLGTRVIAASPFPYDQLPVYHASWVLQAIGAFPLRDEPAPMPVYAIWGILLVVLIVLLFRRAELRERVAAMTVLILLAVVPTILTVISYRTESVAWQGRYSLPLCLGLTSIAGMVLDKRPIRLSRTDVMIVSGLLGAAMTMSTVHVGLREIAHGPADPVAASWPGGMVLVGLLTMLGAMAPVAIVAATGAARSSPDHRSATSKTAQG